MSTLEYRSVVWDSHGIDNNHQLEQVQRKIGHEYTSVLNALLKPRLIM